MTKTIITKCPDTQYYVKTSRYQTLPAFFTLQKLKTYRNPYLKYFRRPSIGDEVQVTFTS